MYASSVDMLELISGQIANYVIPRYQRRYEWKVTQWHGVARDTFELTSSSPNVKHFFGSFLTRTQDRSTTVKYDLIDGQQRILTTGLWLIALADHDREFNFHTIPNQRWRLNVEVSAADKLVWQQITEGNWEILLEESDPAPLFEAYLYFRWLLWLGPSALSEYLPLGDVSGKGAERVYPDLRKRNPGWLSQRTKPGLLDLFTLTQAQLVAKLGNDKRKGGPDRRAEIIASAAPVQNAEQLVQAFMRFQLVHMKFDAAQDEDEAVIFRNLNGQGTPLLSIDHVKNRLFLSIGSEGDRIHKEFWEPAELQLDKVSYAKKRDEAGTLFLYDFLISRGVKDASKSRLAWQLETYQASLARSGNPNAESKQDFIENHLVSAMWDWMVVVENGEQIRDPRLVNRPIPVLARARMRSIQLSSIAVIPLLLRFVGTWRLGALSDEQLLEYLKLVDGYLMRALVAGKNLSPLRAETMGLLGGFPQYPAMPTIEQFRTKVRDLVASQNLDLSNSAMKKQLLESAIYEEMTAAQCFNLLVGIEIYGQRDPADYSNAKGKLSYTVEHIAPQALKRWQQNLLTWGVPEDLMKSYVHRLGNLSLATRTFNSEQGNNTLAIKQGKLGEERALHLNQSWSEKKVWRPQEINERAKELTDRFNNQWPQP